MKILVVQDRLRSGGTERQSILLANAFASAGHPTDLLTFRPGGALNSSVSAAVTRTALQPFDTGFDFWAPGLLSFVRRLQPEVILCMGRMTNCRAGALQQALPSASVIATLRTGKELPWLFRRSLKTVRHIVANSDEARTNLLRHHGVKSERASVIHNALVFARPAPAGSREQLRQRFGATSETTVLLNVAMFRPEKNQRELIDIVAGLPAGFPWQLWLAGDGPSRAPCEKLVEGKGLSASVKFLGWQKDPAPLYAAADIAVHASTSEALSNFLIEAQAAGLPAVAAEAQGISECFVPGLTGFTVARGDRDRFRQQILAFARASTEKRAEISSQAKEFSLTAFDHDRQVARYLELFQQLRQQT